mgnify:CR=1 FL=1
MSQLAKDESMASPANWTIAGTTVGFSLFLAVSAVLYILAEIGAGPSLGLFAATLLGFLIALMFLVVNLRARGSAKMIVRIVCLMMLAFIALFSVAVNGPNPFVLLLLLIPICFGALHMSRAGTVIVAVACAAVWVLLNISLWSGDPVMLVSIGLHLLPLVLVAGLVHTLNKAVVRSRSRIAHLADQDSLTGLLNMKSFRQILAVEHERAGSKDISYALLLIDIDGLKAINDEHGREEGDRVLLAIADALTRSIRQEDRIARYGSDEFILYLAYASDKIAQDVANRVRQNIYNMTLSFGNRAKRIKIGLGMAIYPDSGASVQELITFADKAMQTDKAFRRREKPASDARQQAGVDLP